MATYAIGDVQGCYRSLRALLDRIAFAPAADRLWLVGDLVNRGPRSLDVLRWARDHEHALVCVLGNHDLYLIGCWEGVVRPRRRDTFDEILATGDAAELIGWLNDRPLIHHDDGWLLVHAGLLPAWSTDEAIARARRVEATLRTAGDARRELLERRPPAYPEELCTQRETLDVLTRLRMLDQDGRPRWRHKGPPHAAPPGERAWFDDPAPRWAGARVLFGHWSTLGRYVAPPLYGLDSGCVWGGELTALRLDDGALYTQPMID